MAIKPIPPSRMGRKKLRNPNPEVTRRLLEAAADLLHDTPFPQLRVEEIATRAGVSVGTFYLYFDGKDDLFVQLVVEFTGRLRKVLQAAYAGPGSFADRMQRALDAYLTFVEENQAGFLYFRDSGTIDTTVGRLSAWAIDQHVTDLRPILDEAVSGGELRGDDTTLLAHAILGLTQHLAGFWLEHREHCSRSELQRFLNQFVTFGCGGPRPS